MSNFVLKNGKKMLFMGDSITDCGRRNESFPYGNGYAKLAIDMITAKYPERNIKYVNKGISGNTTFDLMNRWEDDVIAVKPDYISIKIGINDLHSVYDNWGGKQVPAGEFRKYYDNILERTKEQTKAKIILIDPFYLSKDLPKPKVLTSKNNRVTLNWNNAAGMRAQTRRADILKQLDEYIAVVHEMAKKYNTELVKTHEAFQTQMIYRDADSFGAEPVHPYQNGHMLIALELLKKLKW